MITIKRSASYLRSMWCPVGHNKFYEVLGLVIFGDGEIKFERKDKWFEARYQYPNTHRSYTNDVLEFNLNVVELKRHNKVDLNRKYSHYVYGKDYFNVPGAVLYIHVSDIGVENRREVLDVKTETEEKYLMVADLTFNYGCKLGNFKGEVLETGKIVCSERFYSRTEKTDFGSLVEKTREEMDGLNIKLDLYSLEKLLKHYELVKKEV